MDDLNDFMLFLFEQQGIAREHRDELLTTLTARSGDSLDDVLEDLKCWLRLSDHCIDALELIDEWRTGLGGRGE